MKRFILSAIALLLCGVAPAFAETASDVKSGPWITEMTQTGMTVMWTSKTPGQAWVELEDGTIIWETFAGRRIFGDFHKVEVECLTPGAAVKYRGGGRLVVDDTNARDPKMGETYSDDWHTVRTFDNKAKSCRFTVFNDIHLDVENYSAMAAEIDTLGSDFIFLNGDIIDAGNYQQDNYLEYTIDPLGNAASCMPVFFARGNHEGRGNGVKVVSQVFPNKVSSNGFYYTFRQGPVAFLVLDGGETGESRSVRYSGAEVYEDYLEEQIEWLQKAIKEPEFRKAPVKICMLHIPMIDHPDKSDYKIQRWLNVHILPLLNKAKFNLMIGADLHEYRCDEAGTMNNNFPIVTNSEVERLVCDCEGKEISIRIYNPDGNLLHSLNF